MQVANLWILLGLGIELILFSLIAYAFLTWRKERLTQPWRKDVELLENQISQADALMGRIFKELNSRFVDFKELFQKLEHKEAQINELFIRADNAMTEMPSSAGKHDADLFSTKYRDVILLNKEGCPREQIYKRTGIGENEMDLILRLRGKERR